MSELNVNAANVRVLGHVSDAFRRVLTPDALRFLAFLHEQFEPRRQALLAARVQRQKELDAGVLPDFLPETAYIREGDWKVASIPADLADRRVEITGPVDRKMVINALNSGSKCYMADFEDSTAPTWFNQVDGQVNLVDAVRKTISYTHPQTGKKYALNDKVATLLVRPRGWHLDEAHVLVNNQIMSGSLFDFGLYFFHNAHELLARGSGPYFYLPKLEHHLEAKLWNDVFVAAQGYLSIPQGSIRATVLVETIVAVFQMDEILYELRNHSSGLNCGRWDYIFSYIKKFRNHSKFVVPDRSSVGMTTPFMAAYVKLLVRTCHRRGAHAMGGMAAQIPVKNDPELNNKFMAAVTEDKSREVAAGHDGTWVAHPGLVKIAMDAFSKMTGPNQISFIPEAGKDITAAQLIEPPTGPITYNGLVENIDVSLVYTEAWLRGSGCIPLHNKMEDAATAEISRAQVWQWIRHSCKTVEGKTVTKALVLDILKECVNKRSLNAIPGNKWTLGGEIMGKVLTGDDMVDFLTLPCYPRIVQLGSSI
ncbi:Malate synthase, glyoxysomal [Phytophthora fragariae]|uniref:Malate synthase n=1 Tax=Phytophthora fragariae TaxID=53985 RepID=A0A6A3UMV1_9STRA|nr:Malate synthase, glyoxysomal [Phytophthora fragariae]KAE8948986.1 Malate synthase, glyoxysomal [Phytophthora fragariae]KAE9029990.1 Malate synthase, glyoxysomal [Phytophthora fragariae]KAE9137913.1 Malate synthase, glyoxysomal [Phytophthora fragariae]KAE9138707.1 Malate synthase, glyoxysomal [Phytophthora fragariae]